MIQAITGRKDRQSAPWWLLLLFGWISILGFSIYVDRQPVETVFDAGDVRVADTTFGTCAMLTFDRDINAQFRGEWRVTLLRKQPAGGFATVVPNYSGGNDYVPGNTLPEGLHLGWWVGLGGIPALDVCPWPPGIYKVRTVWTVQMPNGGERIVTRTSNAFRIRPPG